MALKEKATIVAAVDLGSNSFHLTVAELVNNELKTLGRLKDKVRLAAGLDDNLFLTEEAQQKAIRCLKQFHQRLQGIDSNHVKAVGTYTLRKAKNLHEFLPKAEAALGYPIEVISGHEEARLIFTGVSQHLANTKKNLVIDIGGGSTEFAIGRLFEPVLLDSLQMGCISFTHKFFADGKITLERFSKAIIAARLELMAIQDIYLRESWDHAVGCSGTVESVLQVLMVELPNKEFIKYEDLIRLRDKVIGFKEVDNINFEGLSELRQEIFPSGLSILIAIFQALNIRQLSCSSAALREGVLFELSGREKHYDIRERAINSLLARFHVDSEQARRVNQAAHRIYHMVSESWQLDDEFLYQYLSWACRCHEVGLTINFSRQQKHGDYLIRNIDIDGFTQQQQFLLALLVRSCRRKFPLHHFDKILNPEQRIKFIRLSRILRLAVLFNHRRRDLEFPPLQIRVREEVMTLEFQQDFLSLHPLLEADLQLEQQFLRDIGLELIIC